MDILRKELNEIYARQHLEQENLDEAAVGDSINAVGTMVSVCRQCAIITDAARDRSFLFFGDLCGLLGLPSDERRYMTLSSSDEDCIYTRMHPEDLVDKRMLEYEFFQFIEKVPISDKTGYKAVCRIRLKNRNGEYIYVDNSTQLLRPSAAGKIWLILCCYALSPAQATQMGIDGKIINNRTGGIIPFSFSDGRNRLLTPREKEILRLIKVGKLSKEIASQLGISVHTVNRHRQNVLEKLSVGNSMEAVEAAIAMHLI